MPLGLLFWIIMLVSLFFHAYWNWGPTPNWGPLGGGIIVWVLFFILGWHAFGFPIHGG